MSEADLLARLEQALASLPDAERTAVVTALGYDEGVEAVAQEQGLSHEQAEALTRSAVQLLRGALADCDADTREVFARGLRRRSGQPRAE